MFRESIPKPIQDGGKKDRFREELGDSESVFACDYKDESVLLASGNIDCPELQQKFVDIRDLEISNIPFLG